MGKEKFTKQQFLESEKFRQESDIISVILEDEKLYTISEVEAMISEFLKVEVN